MGEDDSDSSFSDLSISSPSTPRGNSSVSLVKKKVQKPSTPLENKRVENDSPNQDEFVDDQDADGNQNPKTMRFRPRHYVRLLLEYQMIPKSYIPTNLLEKVREIFKYMGFGLGDFISTAHFQTPDVRYLALTEAEFYEGKSIDSLGGNLRQKIITLGTQFTEQQVRYSFDIIKTIGSRSPYGLVSMAELLEMYDHVKLSIDEAKFVLHVLVESGYIYYSKGINSDNDRIPAHVAEQYRKIFSGAVRLDLVPYKVASLPHYSLGDRSILEFADLLLDSFMRGETYGMPLSPLNVSAVPSGHEAEPNSDNDNDNDNDNHNYNSSPTTNTVASSSRVPKSPDGYSRQPEDQSCCVCLESVYCGLKCEYCPSAYHLHCYNSMDSHNCLNCRKRFSEIFITIIDIITKCFAHG